MNEIRAKFKLVIQREAALRSPPEIRQERNAME